MENKVQDISQDFNLNELMIKTHSVLKSILDLQNLLSQLIQRHVLTQNFKQTFNKAKQELSQILDSV